MEEHLISAAASRIPSDAPAAARTIVERFLDGVLGVLGPSVEGVVLFGSLAAGDFSADTSDIDLIVAVAAEIDDERLQSLRSMHERLASAHPDWRNRLDVVYVAADHIRNDRGDGSPLVVISPGEPIHRTRTDPGWIMNWHSAREFGCSLMGPSPNELVVEISDADLASAVRFYLRWLQAKTEALDTPALRSYAILAACRALHTCSTGNQTSKEDAALWAMRQYPEWSAAVRSALESRATASSEGRPQATMDSVGSDFVRFALRVISEG